MAKPSEGQNENQQLRKLDGVDRWQGRMGQTTIGARHDMFALLRAILRAAIML